MTTTNLVKGYIATDFTAGTEVLYAVTPAGVVYQTEPLTLPNPNFDKPGRKWSRIEALPERVEFCGNYPTPVGMEA